jgi:hypothetical protein
MERAHNRVTAADVVAFALTLAAFAGACYCVLSALGSI